MVQLSMFLTMLGPLSISAWVSQPPPLEYRSRPQLLSTTTTATKAGRSLRRPFFSTLEATDLETQEGGTNDEIMVEIASAGSKTSTTGFPELGEDGLYHIHTPEQHKLFMEGFRDKLVVLKVFAPWCRACKGLAPKFSALVHDPKYQSLPLVWAELSIQHNKQFVKSIGVLALPTVQFYVGGALADTFPCGPSKVPILKRKLAQLVNQNVDPETLAVKVDAIERAIAAGANDTLISNQMPTTTPEIQDESESTLPPPVKANHTAESSPTWVTRAATDKPPLISLKERIRFRETIPHLASMNLADYDEVMDKARLLTFEAGAIIMREGKKGKTFYIIKEGEVEICQKTYAQDPLQYSASYLGSVVNRLEKGDFFGERSLLTGEPRAASIRAAETTSCYAFDRSDFPISSPLSGRTNQLFTEKDLDLVNDKYGVDLGSGLYAQQVVQQIRDANAASQVQGSIHHPQNIVEPEDEVDQTDASFSAALAETTKTERNNAIFTVLRRFKMIRQVSKCLNYIQLTNAQWGEDGSRIRRAMLVKRLSKAQREEFTETFELIDSDDSGTISLLELKKVMQSVGEEKTEEELRDYLILANNIKDANGYDPEAADLLKKKLVKAPPPELNQQDFLGLMAEAEFYYLIYDIFKTLDAKDSGYVKAADLDRVLCGIRDLISDDRKSIIDVAQDDMDMLIDYEQFTRMLLGSAA